MGRTPQHSRPPKCDLILSEIGIAIEDVEIVGSCAYSAVRLLRQGSPKDAVELGQSALKLLESHKQPLLELISEIASAAERIGNMEMATELRKRCGISMIPSGSI